MRVPGWVVGVAGLAVGTAIALVLLETSSSDPTTPNVASPQPWDDVVDAARGQTVRLWMWGGEQALNAYVDEQVVPRASAAGVTLERVPIDDTATAVAQVASELEAGRRSGGSVDLLWVNGPNFAQGRDAGLWLRDWTHGLPNTALLDPADPTLSTDFAVPTDGQELPWSRAAFVFAYDPVRTPDPPRNFGELAQWVRDHPGRFTYPAPPDFTGSAFVRQAVQALGEDAAFAMLTELEPMLWAGGDTHPRDEPELERLFGDGEIDLAMSYNPNFVDVAVGRGVFPETARPYVFADGTLQNVSFVAIPANASSREGAQVVANLMLSPELQAAKRDDVGIPSVLDHETLARALDQLGPTRDEHRLTNFGTPLAELPAAEVPRLDRRWQREVLG